MFMDPQPFGCREWGDVGHQLSAKLGEIIPKAVARATRFWRPKEFRCVLLHRVLMWDQTSTQPSQDFDDQTWTSKRHRSVAGCPAFLSPAGCGLGQCHCHGSGSRQVGSRIHQTTDFKNRLTFVCYLCIDSQTIKTLKTSGDTFPRCFDALSCLRSSLIIPT